MSIEGTCIQKKVVRAGWSGRGGVYVRVNGVLLALEVVAVLFGTSLVSSSSGRVSLSKRVGVAGSSKGEGVGEDTSASGNVVVAAGVEVGVTCRAGLMCVVGMERSMWEARRSGYGGGKGKNGMHAYLTLPMQRPGDGRVPVPIGRLVVFRGHRERGRGICRRCGRRRAGGRGRRG